MSIRRIEQIAALWEFCSGPQTPLLPWRKASGPSPSVSLAESRQWWQKLHERHQIIQQRKRTILHASLSVCLFVCFFIKDMKPLSDSHTSFSWCPPFPQHSLLPSVPYDWKYIRTWLKLSHSSEMCLYTIKVNNFSDKHSWMALSSALCRRVQCSPSPSFVGRSWKKK